MNYRSLLVTGAHKLELQSFKNHFSVGKRENFGSGKIDVIHFENMTIYLLVTGIGLKKSGNSLHQAMKYLKSHNSKPYPEALLNIGVSGAIHPERKIGDIIIGESAISEGQDGDHFPFDGSLFKQLSSMLQMKNIDFASGKIYSSNKAVADERRRRQIWETYNIQVVDMESAAIARNCQLLRVPCLSIKYVSDNADAFAMKDFLANMAEAADILGEIAYDFIKQLRRDPA